MPKRLLIGEDIPMTKGNKQLYGSAQMALQHGENVFMVFTGTPYSSRKPKLSDMYIPQAKKFMKQHHMHSIVIHAPYIINLANTKRAKTFNYSEYALKREIKYAEAVGCKEVVLHPGSHVGAGADKGIASVIKGLNDVLSENQTCQIAIETMAGKGTEVGKTFEQIAQIINGVTDNDKLAVCFDTCHTDDAGYDIKNHFDDVMNKFDHVIGINRLKVVHLNDSKNPLGAHKDRHANIGTGYIGFKALNYVAHYPQLQTVPKILETPMVKLDKRHGIDPCPYEIKMLNKQHFVPNYIESAVKKQVPIDDFDN